MNPSKKVTIISDQLIKPPAAVSLAQPVVLTRVTKKGILTNATSSNAFNQSPQTARAKKNFQMAIPEAEPRVETTKDEKLHFMCKEELILLVKKHEGQIKSLQNLNKAKNMTILRREKKIKELQERKEKEKDIMETLLKENFDEPFISVILDHIKNRTKPLQAHRFTQHTKNFAQILHFLCPKVVRVLRHQFHVCLPSETTISRITCDWDLSSGFNPLVLVPLKAAIEGLSEAEKVVILTCDEMAIETTIAYDRKNDKVVGLDSRVEEGLKMAKQALVFMVSTPVLFPSFPYFSLFLFPYSWIFP